MNDKAQFILMVPDGDLWKQETRTFELPENSDLKNSEFVEFINSELFELFEKARELSRGK